MQSFSHIKIMTSVRHHTEKSRFINILYSLLPSESFTIAAEQCRILQYNNKTVSLELFTLLTINFHEHQLTIAAIFNIFDSSVWLHNHQNLLRESWKHQHSIPVLLQAHHNKINGFYNITIKHEGKLTATKKVAILHHLKLLKVSSM